MLIFLSFSVGQESSFLLSFSLLLTDCLFFVFSFRDLNSGGGHTNSNLSHFSLFSKTSPPLASSLSLPNWLTETTATAAASFSGLSPASYLLLQLSSFLSVWLILTRALVHLGDSHACLQELHCIQSVQRTVSTSGRSAGSTAIQLASGASEDRCWTLLKRETNLLSSHLPVSLKSLLFSRFLLQPSSLICPHSAPLSRFWPICCLQLCSFLFEATTSSEE